MAFSRDGLSRIGGSGTGGTVWMYTSNDTVADTQATGYFNEAKDVFLKGDAIFIAKEEGTSHLHITFVKTITALGVVTVAPGTTITAA
jgi:hypothetical protein